MSDDIRLYQIYYNVKQKPLLDPAFIPYDNSLCSDPDEREFYVFRKEYRTAPISTGYSGYVSWKFGSKTGLTGEKFISFCKASPGEDVYFVNPFPLQISKGNIWVQGEKSHPGLLGLAQFIFDSVGYDIDLKSLPARLDSLAFCNYWLGNRLFWDRYMSFCIPIYNFVRHQMPEPRHAQFFALAGPSASASHFPYFFERLFTTFLVKNPDINAKRYEFTDKELEWIYSKPEISLIRKLERNEKAFASSPEPITCSPTLKLELDDYDKSLITRNVIRRTAYLAAQTVWHTIPFRRKLLRYDFVRRFSKLILFCLGVKSSKNGTPNCY